MLKKFLNKIYNQALQIPSNTQSCKFEKPFVEAYLKQEVFKVVFTENGLI